MRLLYRGYEITGEEPDLRIYKDAKFVEEQPSEFYAQMRIDEIIERASTRVLGNSIELINEPDHHRFWLPNRDYIYDMQKVRIPAGMAWRHHIIHNETQRVIDFIVDGKVYRYFDLPATHPHIGRFNLYAQELAAKRYPRPVRRDRAGKKEKESVVYNVVNKDNPNKPLMEHTAFLHMAQQFKAVQVVKYPRSVFEIVETTQGS